MFKDDRVYVDHIVDSAERALRLIQGKSKDNYDRDEVLRLALTHLLQIIGEAARKLSSEFCEKFPEIPWKAMIGMRHKVVHDYMDVDEDIVWDTVNDELPGLIILIKKTLSTLVSNEQK